MTPAQIRHEAEAYERGESEAVWDDDSKTEARKESQLWRAILKPLKKIGDEGYWAYSCREWNTTTQRCTIYDRRPGFCRSYGKTDACNHGGCTWKDAKTEDKDAAAEFALNWRNYPSG